MLQVILSYDYLWTQVRVMGGAYGVMSGFGRGGDSYFVSYRDPHLKKTYETFGNIPEYLRGFDAGERDMTKYVIGAVSGMDTPMTPYMKGARNVSLFLSGVTEAQLKRSGIRSLAQARRISGRWRTLCRRFSTGATCAPWAAREKSGRNRSFLRPRPACLNGEYYGTAEKIRFAALIGRPNVGKSTLMNHLIGQKIAITSNRPQTTRNRIQTVYTDERGQIVFLDTPGIHKAKNKLGRYMVEAAEKTLKEADVILWLVEPSTYAGAGEQHILEILRQVKTPVVLVINKADTVEKKKVMEAAEAYGKLYGFAEIVPVSALKGRNLDTLLDALMKYLPYGPMYYDEDTVTDQPMRQIAAEMIREKALRLLTDEIPMGSR